MLKHNEMIYHWHNSYNLIRFISIDSTNAEALRLIKSGKTDNCIILSQNQTRGRGRKGKQWLSKLGNLYVSIILESRVNPDKHIQISFIVANAIYDAIESIRVYQNLNVTLSLKWPNDVLLNSKKVAGILLESIFIAYKYYIIIGIGINIMDCPNINTATSLRYEGIVIDNTEDFFNIILNKFEILYNQWIRERSFTTTRCNWIKRAYNINKVIIVDNGTNIISGLFIGINNNGFIVLKLQNGDFYTLSDGSII
jgi:BirA family biotin operon repressor/biotin-[acetyl-CoA-carboxylase] ligase